MLSDFGQVAAVVFIAMNCMFLLAMVLKNNSIIDIFWGPGFSIIAVFLLFPFDTYHFTQLLYSALITIWAARLSIHIFLRNRGKAEDFRYANWRKTWKHFILRSYFQVFMLQGFLMLVIALPVIAFLAGSYFESTGFTWVGSFVFLAGFLMESTADYQLKVFRQKAENKGHIIRTGLWNYSRHPNYFGEALLWWGLWIYSVPGTPWYITIISPVAITLLLRYVSGVPMLENKYSLHPEWADYSSKTPVFIPRFW